MALLLAHDVAGQGPPVVLLHSGVCDRRMWEPQWGALSERFRCVRCDLRGYGETPLRPEEFSHAVDLARLLDHLGIEKTAVVGSSLGGRVALEFASEYPERIDKLVLLCPALTGVPATEEVERFGTEEDALLEAADLEAATELNVRTWLGPDASGETKALVRDMQRHALEVQLASGDDETMVPVDVDAQRIGAPVLLISGARDLEFFGNVARYLVKALEQARHVELAWAAHLPSLERPHEVTELLVEFLADGHRVHGPATQGASQL